ncbi:ABC-2 type transport system ATP-binding protein [Ardenticatena maritima]|uniref:ABC-2 type transport system ATP-binding protein n=1 Tax=Ardenticatena maritima TaxID=872965 RepID=A0A0M8K7R4_9CHLR|nr:ABC transporter ATP-binding protein [Ardenticatena maritima]KPL87833.1 hypothetical protein SE16_09785 [Ardenticatena maritima]GAP62046.1 ABC-2 type transport system ATP-binding protein [Ardenticatena maritima]
MSTQPLAIETRHLTKRYGSLVAVDSLSLAIPRGVVCGFIGPNGAGKTTTLRMLAGLLKPTSGEIRIEGVDILAEPERIPWLIGYMPDFFGVYHDMKVWEYLDFFARAYRIPAARRPGLIADLLELVDLSHKRDAFVQSLSRGMRQRLCLAHTLVHDPHVLLLDEPASGLDPRARVEMRELLRELGRMNKTVFISSHILTELAELCDMVVIIEKGKLVTAGNVREISAMTQGYRLLQVELLAPDRDTPKALELLRQTPGVQDVFTTDDHLEIAFAGDAAQQAALLERLIHAGISVLTFGEATTDLEDLFLQLTKGEVQ